MYVLLHHRLVPLNHLKYCIAAKELILTSDFVQGAGRPRKKNQEGSQKIVKQKLLPPENCTTPPAPTPATPHLGSLCFVHRFKSSSLRYTHIRYINFKVHCVFFYSGSCGRPYRRVRCFVWSSSTLCPPGSLSTRPTTPPWRSCCAWR